MNRILYYFKNIKLNPVINRTIADKNKKMFIINKQQNTNKNLSKFNYRKT
jgi:hypothetical protein